MFALEHKVRVFVFRIGATDVEYLLLRKKPRSEWPLGPVVGPIAVDEHLKDAVLREVRIETGLCKPLHVLDLSTPSKELFGDVGLVEWPFGYQAGAPGCPAPAIVPGPMVGDCAWLPFERAFQAVEVPADRDALVKLQLRLRG
ncbi:MAG TPA: NUDIX domain-containing protein [Planctomycetota bacterium]|nr:NUDIX domain-containing protein [Planctomycetota bacterium]